MFEYAKYVSSLKELALAQHQNNDGDAVLNAINGEAYSFLRSSIALETRRESGAFFTETELAKKIGKEVFAKLGSCRVFDPACGAGNLLLGYAWYLPLSKTLRQTIHEWSKLLCGFDIHQEFVDATKLRLILLARQRGKFSDIVHMSDDIFPFILQRDALQYEEEISRVDVIITNPPYTSVEADRSCKWGSGEVTAASKFIDHLTKHASPGCRIYAILPEVIRCGSRYEKLRGVISERVQTLRLDSIGQFDKWTDIDVFVAYYKKLKNARARKKSVVTKNGETISTYFNVCVGPVVHYRDPNTQTKYPFAHARNMPPWETISHLEEMRGFEGRLIRSPCVVIRRTSRPGDSFRAIGTIINISGNVAIENHLIVASPKDGTLESCEHLLAILKLKYVNSILNDRMRCRHLTVGVIKSIPWSENNG